MARYRKIDPRIWNDGKFRDMSDNGKLVFLFLLTHPHMTALGAMRATVAGLAEELGWCVEAFRKAFHEALLKGMAEHDAKACLIALPNFIRYNSPESPNVVKAWANSLDLLPECGLKTRVTSRAKAFAEALPEAFAKALPEAFAKGMPYQEQEQEQEQEQSNVTCSPSVSELADDGFATFWAQYPKKVAKPQALKAWKKIKPAGRLLADLIAALKKQKASADWLKDDGRFVPHPATWLNGRRWEDEALPAADKTAAPARNPIFAGAI